MAIIHGRDTGRKTREIRVDPLGRIITSADPIISPPGEGELFVAWHEYTVPSQGTVHLQLKTPPNHYVQMISRVAQTTQNDWRVVFLRAPTVTDGTTPATIRNIDDNSPTLPLMQAFVNPTNVAGGVEIDRDLIPGGRGPGAPGAVFQVVGARFLRPGLDYVATVNNLDNQEAKIVMKWLWVEIPVT